MKRALRLLVLTSAGELLALIAWFLWMERRVSRECDRIDAAYPPPNIDALLMEFHATTKGKP